MRLQFFTEISNVRAFTSTRADGVMGSSLSPGPEGSFFLNRQKFLASCGLDGDKLVLPGQIHGTHIEYLAELPKPNVVEKEDFSAEVRRLKDTDGLITRRPGIILGVVHSDCFPVFLVSRDNTGDADLIAILHAGRKGTRLGIVFHGIREMQGYGAKPREIHVAIGPGICKECHTLTRDYHEEDISFFLNMHSRLIEEREGKWHLDLLGVVRKQLVQSGVLEENIEVLPECTAHPGNETKWASYRRDTAKGENAPNQLSVITLHEMQVGA